MFMKSILLAFAVTYSLWPECRALYPRESETRDVRLLDGFWNFRVIPLEDKQDIGFTGKWYEKPLTEVSVLFDINCTFMYTKHM